MSVNFPNWITADIMIPEYVDRYFRVRVKPSEVDPTAIEVEWFDKRIWISVPPEDRDKLQSLSNEFIDRFIADYKLQERTKGLSNAPNDEVVWARIEGVISAEMLRYESENGISFKEALSRYLLDGTTFANPAIRMDIKMDMN